MGDLKKILGYIGCVGAVIIVAVFAAVWQGFHKGERGNLNQGNAGLCQNVPIQYSTIFESSGNKWKVQQAFIAAIFYVEHGKSWPNYEDHAAVGTRLNPTPHNCTSDVGCIRGPMQIGEKNWPNWTKGAYGKELPAERIEWTKDAIDVATWHLAMIGAGGNTTDLDKLRDAASKYNSGRPWSVGQGIAETAKYVPRVIEAYQNFYCTSLAGSGDIVRVAQAELGTKEDYDNCDCGAVLKYGGKTGDSWCAFFVSWVYKKAGYNIPSIGGARNLYEWFGKNQTSFKRGENIPQPGDIIYFSYSHVGIVESYENNIIHTIEGNTSDRNVKREKHNINNTDIVGFGRWKK